MDAGGPDQLSEGALNSTLGKGLHGAIMEVIKNKVVK